MNCWELLDIPATGDGKAIKRAYTRLLRKFPPETDPEGFKNLRSAYEEAAFLAECGFTGAEPLAAVQAAPGADAPSEAAAEGKPEADGPGAAVPAELPGFVLRMPEPPPATAGVEEAMARIERDFPVHAMRESETYWKALAESELLWDLTAKAELGERLFRFLGEKYLENGSRYTYIHVPKGSWKVLDDAFGWLENEREWYIRFPEEQANAVLDRIRGARDMALSTDLKSEYHPVRDLLIKGSDPDKNTWVASTLGAIFAILGVLALNGVFFRCS